MSTKEEIPRLFGTNGIRGVPNEDLTVEFSSDIGKAAAAFFDSPVIAIGRDTRITGDMITYAVVSGVLSTGTNVIDLGVLPTPALQYYCKVNELYGIVITASHNPPQFNGIKCVDKDGTELERTREEEIEKIYHYRKFKKASWENIGIYSRASGAIENYIKGVLSHVDVEKIKERKLRVAFDAGNGAAFFSTPSMLSALGCSITTLNANPDGKFTSRNSEPKPENLTDLINLMKMGKFDLGIAHDGDADRAVFIDETGKFIDGDKSLTLITKRAAKRGEKVVTPISSSDAIDEVCRELGSVLIRTKVGAPIVSRTMIKEKALIGGEENGGIIYGKHQYCRDGAMAAALVLDLMAKERKKVSNLLKEIPDYSIVKSQVHLKKKWEEIKPSVIDYVSGRKTDEMDGIKVIEKDGWALIRPSGTEPIVRVYGQSKDYEKAKKLNREFVELIEKIQS